MITYIINRDNVKYETIFALLITMQDYTFWLPKKFFSHSSTIEKIIINIPSDFQININNNDYILKASDVFKDK